MPSNPTLKRDAPKAARPLAPRYASTMNLRAVFVALAAIPISASAVDRVCAPTSMLKVVTALDVPGAPKDHFVRKPKTLYRQGERFGRVEESRNTETGLHLLVVTSEPDMWVADLASKRGNYQKDAGPTYYFRAVIFGDPNIRSRFINSLEFGCESEWLSEVGATKTSLNHADLGAVERFVYTEGHESLSLFLRRGTPTRLELHRNGALYVAVRYLQYSPDLPFQPSLFTQPFGIAFNGEQRR